VRISLRGVRGSIPVADPGCTRYGGNTSCVAVELEEGPLVVLDAGTGIRRLGSELAGKAARVHILLTHLHLDHIMGLLFFAPLHDPDAEVTIWGPPSTTAGLRTRLGRYLSTPLSPVEIRELPAHVTFRECPDESWRIGSATVCADAVIHRGPTLGYRLEENGTAFAYIPDHEPALGQRIDSDPAEWISGHALARGASLLLHDGQYTEAEYVVTEGWGHSAFPDALTFARRVGAARVLLFHHDPAHEDTALDELGRAAAERWADLGAPGELDLAREGETLEI
jgi:phosphoribosyl 1,2-cyclic phosphodiesterase